MVRPFIRKFRQLDVSGDGRLGMEDKVRKVRQVGDAPSAAQREAWQKEALEQAGELLKYGFTAAGFGLASLNTAYEPRGHFDGMPLFREINGGRAAAYWRAAGRATSSFGCFSLRIPIGARALGSRLPLSS